jgi:hypothetical protein
LNHTTTIAIIRIIIAAALAVSMVVAGASLSSVLLQQQKGFAAPQTKKQEQNTIQNLHGNFAKRSAAASQHLDLGIPSRANADMIMAIPIVGFMLPHCALDAT